MKTTVDIPDADLADLMRATAARTKREAILEAIREYNRKRKLKELATVFGTFREFMTRDELEHSRQEG
jgi:Arc/MetJ family transcription regulator